jgi:DNA-binding transcriptional ArsR family regulator
MDISALLIHPVRLRIVHALSGGRRLTPKQLHHLLSDVSVATVYRQVALLEEGGLIEVADERPVRGVVERTYRLTTDRPPVDESAVAAATPDDHRRAFGIATATLLAEFGAYLDRPGSSPAEDLVTYQQMALWLSRAELEGFLTELSSMLRRLRDNAPTPGRARYLFSPILLPTERAADV